MLKRMFLLFSFLLMFLPYAYAHPPQEIKLNYDAKTKILQGEIIHNVSNPLTHCINKVDIALNGRKIIEHKISRQDNHSSQVVSYLIPDAKKGDIISVEAYCSISGKLMKEIKVKD